MTNSTRKPTPLPSPAHDVVRFINDDNFQQNYDTWKDSLSGAVEIVDRDYIREDGVTTQIFIYYRLRSEPLTLGSGRNAITTRPPARPEG
jgi:hypothetical protein